MTDEEIGQPEQEALQLEVDEEERNSADTNGQQSEGPAANALSVEDLVESLEMVTAERDDFRDSLQRLQADF